MHIHSRGLKYFDMIRRCGSIREAARQLHVSSSSVNRQLLQMEAEFGSPLFERLSTGLRLTAAGEIVARHVTTVLQDAQRMGGDLDALRGIRRGSIDVMAVEALTSSFLPEVLAVMRKRYPAVQVRVRIAGSEGAALAVAAGDADVALCFMPHRHEALRQLALGRFALGAAVSRTHPLAGQKRASFAECARHPLILPGPEFSMHAEVKALQRAAKRPAEVVLETGSFELMKQFAVRGEGIAFVNRFGIERELAADELRHLPLKPAVVSNLGVYVRAGRAPPPALDAFVRISAEEVARREAAEGRR